MSMAFLDILYYGRNFLINLMKYRVKREARRVFGSRIIANEWLNTPIAALGQKRPIDLLESPEGYRDILNVLKRIEMGEFS